MGFNMYSPTVNFYANVGLDLHACTGGYNKQVKVVQR